MPNSRKALGPNPNSEMEWPPRTPRTPKEGTGAEGSARGMVHWESSPSLAPALRSLRSLWPTSEFRFSRRLLAGAAEFSGQALGGRLLLGLPARDLRRGGRLPHPGRPIPTAGGNPLAVRGKGYRPGVTAVSFEGEQFLAAGRLPHLGRGVVTAGGNPLAIRGKGNGPDPIVLPFEGEQFLSAGRCPHLGRVVATACDNPLAEHSQVTRTRNKFLSALATLLSLTKFYVNGKN